MNRQYVPARPLSRRRFVQGAGLAGLGLLAGCGRLPGQSEPPAKLARIGYLAPWTSDDSDPYAVAFRQGLHDLGYVEGANLTIDWGASRAIENLPQDAARLVQLPVDIIVVVGLPAALAAKDATAAIPIVMAGVGNPIGAGLITSLARPGGNVTGLSRLAGELGGKRLELLKDTVPGLSGVAVLWNPVIGDKLRQIQELRVAAQVLGMQVQSIELPSEWHVEAAFESIAGNHPGALITLHDIVVQDASPDIIRYAAQHRLPTMAETKAYPEAGMLMAYGPNYTALPRRAAYYVDRILKGAKPSDLPVEQPMTFDFVINLKTAQALGLAIPQHVLLQATEVIQ